MIHYLLTPLFSSSLARGLVLLFLPTLLFGENKPERLEWLKDAGLGLFIHWSVDSQIGTVISHSLVGSSADYQDQFFNDLPETFNPKQFDPDEWARLARIAGFQDVVFTAKHHSGLCMFDSDTNEFNIMNTPYSRDITRELFDAFREQGIATGLYFSPDDFYVLHEQENILREIGAWMMVNKESIYEVRPWKVIREGDIWFTKKKGEDTVFAFITEADWPWGSEKTFSLKSVKTVPESKVSVLGQDDQVLEYNPEVDPRTRWEQGKDELFITATRTQRIYNDRTRPNPIVLKITHAKAR